MQEAVDIPTSSSNVYGSEITSRAAPHMLEAYASPGLLPKDAPISASCNYALELALREVEQLGKAYDTPEWLPKHKIFISHSGRQKDFAEQLCEDLESHGYYPFFDKRSDSLPKGENFPPLIFKAARECLLAIVLLSEDFFTKTKWPLLELATFVQSQKTRKDLRILPVVLDIKIEDLRNTSKWSEVWIQWAQQDQRLTPDVFKEWEAAIQALRPVNMILKCFYDGDLKLRNGIIESISKMMPPDSRFDVVHVQGRERLCKEVCSIFDTILTTSRLCEDATVLGVYGIGGAGKSTLCMIMAEFVRSKFLGRVCIVELGKEKSTVDLQCQVLRTLCRDNEDFLNKHICTEKEGLNRLRERMCREKVFLAIDNVSDDATSISTAKSFLGLKFHPDSMVMVTSRSGDVLCGSLGIPERSCIHCPSITKEEALQLLLEQVKLPFETLDTEQAQVVHQAVELSFFEAYHPLALQLFAAQLETDQSKWTEIKLDLQWASDVEHPLFSKIETNYLRLPDQHAKDMFMDIALFAPECLCKAKEIVGWLSDTINLDCHVDDIMEKLRILRFKSLIDIWKLEDETIRVHDLYGMLAERNASIHNVIPRFIFQRGGLVAPQLLLDKDRSRMVERAAFVEAKFEALELRACTKLQVVSARGCEKLRILCIQRLEYLVSLELARCALESLDLSGLSNLRWLHVSSCIDLMKIDASEVERLQHVNISKCSNLTDLNFKNCSILKSVSFSYNKKLCHVNMGTGGSLKCLTLSFCGSLTDLEINGVVYLSTLEKRGCHQLWAVKGGDIMCEDLQYMRLEKWGRLSLSFVKALETSAALRVLDIWHCCISRLPDLRACSSLQEVRFIDVDVLLVSNNEELIQEYRGILCYFTQDLDLPSSLEDVQIESCRNVVVKEIFWKVQGLRNLRLLSLRGVRVGWDWELYRSRDGLQKTKIFPSPLEKVYAELYKILSHEQNGGTSEDSTCIHDGEMNMLKEGMNLMHQQLSMDMPHKTGAAGYVDEIICWVQVFLDEKTSHRQSNYSREPQLQHGKTDAGVLQRDLQWMFWSSMSKTIETRGSPCWVVEQIIDQTCRNCDSLCECLQQVLSQDLPEGDNISRLMDFCQKVHVEEVGGQLLFLTARQLTDLVQQPNVLEVWERMIIKEVSAWRKFPKCRVENGALMLKALLMRLETLCVCRGWEGESIQEIRGQELMQFAWDWLLACRVCLSLEELKGYSAKEVACQLKLQLLELQRLLSHLDVIFNIELQNFREDHLSSKRGCGFDRISGLSRCWRIRQWLQLLSKQLMQEHGPVENLPVEEVCGSFIEMKGLVQCLKSMEEAAVSLPVERGESNGKGVWAALVSEAEWAIDKVRQQWPDSESFFHCVSNVNERGMINARALCVTLSIFSDQVRAIVFPFICNLMKEERDCSHFLTEELSALLIRLDMQQWQCNRYLDGCITVGGKSCTWIKYQKLYSRWECVTIDTHFLWPSIDFSLGWVETLTTKLIAEIEFLKLLLYPSLCTEKIGCEWGKVVRLILSLRDEFDFLRYAEQVSATRLSETRLQFFPGLKGLWERTGSVLWMSLGFLRALYVQAFQTSPLVAVGVSRTEAETEVEMEMPEIRSFEEFTIAKGDERDGNGSGDENRLTSETDILWEFPPLDVLDDLMQDLQTFYKPFTDMNEQPFTDMNEQRIMLNVGKLSALIIAGRHRARKEKKQSSRVETYGVNKKKSFSMKEMANKVKRFLVGGKKQEMIDLSSSLQKMQEMIDSSFFFLEIQDSSLAEMWDDINSTQLYGIPWFQCSALRVFRTYNCNFITPHQTTASEDGLDGS